jgi:phytoene/squalene synthetase
MNNASARLARSITWASSKQTYLTARFLADRELVDDCLRAYAYFRWADDMIDISLAGREQRFAFIERQKALIEKLYRGERPGDLVPEETMLADLIAHNRAPGSRLSSFIRNFMAVLEFDAHRYAHIASLHELAAYTTCLATAVMDGIQYFIGNCHSYPMTPERNLAVTGAHITHMLRDALADLSAGLINIPAEYLETHTLNESTINSQWFCLWVHEQVDLARYCFRQGRIYIDSLDVLRCKLAGVWYCARFECILNAIERDGYRLRLSYCERHALKTWLEMIRLGFVVTWKHLAARIRSSFYHPGHLSNLNSKVDTPSYRVK